jgi:endonuclease/exonuclease/phosphatase family metal-dependent hydrolase
MEIYKKHFSKYYSELILLSILFLFFFQQITEFVESIYLLSLIVEGIDENIAAVLFLFTPIVLLGFKKGFPNKVMVIFGEIMIICRLLQPFFDAQISIIIAGLGVGSFMIFFPAYLQKKSLENDEKSALMLGISLGFGLALSILFKTLGSSVDISLSFIFQWIGWIFVVIAAIMMINLANPDRIKVNPDDVGNTEKMGSKWKILVLCLGLFGVLTLCYFAFSSPAVIVRWAEGDFMAIISILILLITGFIIIAIVKPDLISKIPLKGILLWNGLFVLMMTLTIGINQVPFPFLPSYPYFAPDTTIFHHIVLYVMIFLSPIVLINFVILIRELFRSRPSTRKMGAAFFASGGFLLLMIFSAVFTTTWDYIPIVGPIFRDMIWLVFLIGGVIMVLPILLVKEKSLIFSKISRNDIIKGYKTVIIIGILAIGTILGGFIVELPRVQTPVGSNTLSILSYNIHQGADEPGNLNFEGQLSVIQNLNPDILALQESDTARIANGNTDIVRYISNNLGYYSYFGPKTVTGTFGIALLSKYPILNARTFYMECVEEQTAAIWAQIQVGTTTFNVFVTHLGNYRNTSLGDGTQIVQQENILTVATGKENVILMGDFNFEPNTEQYNITIAKFYDSYELVLAANPANAVVDPNLPGERIIPDERIDHLFVSHELNESMTYVHYTGGFASDHPALYATMNLASI